jgi:hypothetical protein
MASPGENILRLQDCQDAYRNKMPPDGLRDQQQRLQSLNNRNQNFEMDFGIVRWF